MSIFHYEQPPQPTNGESQAPTPRVQVDLPARKPIVTYVLLGVTVVFYLLQLLSENLTGLDLPFAFLGKFNQLILYGELWRLFTPALLHGSIMHLVFNMYALYIFGNNLEYQYGHLRFFLLYLMGAFAGNVASFVLTANPSLGASTAIFGLLAAEGVFIYRNRRFFGSRARSILTNIVLVLGFNLFLGLTPGSYIDNWGHMGGLIGGLLFAWTAGPLWEMQVDLQGYRLVDKQKKAQVWFGVLVVMAAFSVLAITRWF
ncbi:MAG: hypothetical protein CVU39_13355 [Chloroflexi bacterium HGW-Chloroflexi-10]|nr:MAG: hypothetical protein CVU39_13355 [Chloroflexi bacterium HGW-Chloroflexi-10]